MLEAFLSWLVVLFLESAHLDASSKDTNVKLSDVL